MSPGPSPMFSTIPRDVRVIVAQGDLPDDLRDSLEELRGFRDFELIVVQSELWLDQCLQRSNLKIGGLVVQSADDAEREERDEGGLRAGVVRGFGACDAFDGALAELLGVLGDPLLQRVGGEGG